MIGRREVRDIATATSLLPQVVEAGSFGGMTRPVAVGCSRSTPSPHTRFP